MQDAFGTVIWIVCGVALVIGILALVHGGKAWEEYGRGGLTLDRDPAPRGGRGSVASTAERDDEIRQLLEARNRRRERKGQAPLDVEAEFRRLTAPQVDSELRDEIRQLVVARNHRRVRKGQDPLDVETEIEREISQLPGV